MGEKPLEVGRAQQQSNPHLIHAMALRVASLLIFASLASSATTPCTVVVSPTAVQILADPATFLDAAGHLSPLHAAQAALRGLYASGPHLTTYVVCFAKNMRVTLTVPLKLDDRDTPPHGARVVWLGPASISGGAQVTGWAPVPGSNGTFSAAVPAGSPAAVRQLWVAGERAARTVDTSPWNLLGGLTPWRSADNATVGYVTGRPLPLPAWAANNTAAIEFRWTSDVANWIEPRCTLSSAVGCNITLASPCGGLLWARAEANGYPRPQPPSAIEALPPVVPSSLPSGTFYHDAAGQAIYYSLAPGQTLADLEADAWVPVLDVLVSYNGTANHSWAGVAFEYATWSQPNSPDGYVDQQSAVFLCTLGGQTPGCEDPSAAPPSTIPLAEPPGAVQVSRGTGITFDGCTFAHLGAPYALALSGGTQDSAVLGCAFSDLSGGAVKLGSVFNASGAGLLDPAAWDARMSVVNCTASGVSLEFSSAAVVFVGFVTGCVIDHNSIADAGYTAVSIGWGGGYVRPPGYGNNTVSGSRITRIMKRLVDGGGVYVNGATTAARGGNFVVRNWVDQQIDHGAMFYLDNGADGWVFERNVASNALDGGNAYYLQGCCGFPGANSSLAFLWFNNTGESSNGCAPFGCVVNASSVVNVSGPVWPPEAQAVIDASGASGVTTLGLW